LTHNEAKHHPPERPEEQRPSAFSGNCPCLSGEQYSDCCGRFHRGEVEAPTAEQLMRSRYSAFVVHDAGYLLRTWHPDTRPVELELDPEMDWRRLDIVSTSRGGPLDSEGTVEFKAHFRHDGDRGVHHEGSRFLRVDRRWYYLDAALLK
jgi:SEC-C motif-containing protein